MHLAVVGKESFTMGFRMAGIATCFELREEGEDPFEMERILRRLIERKDIGIIVVEEGDYGYLNPRFRYRLDTLARPVIIALSKEMKGGLRERIKKAMGVDLW